MKENTVIPIKIERLELWSRWTLETADWLIRLGLLSASVAIAACAALVWLVSGSEAILALGLGGGLLLGLTGVWHLLQPAYEGMWLRPGDFPVSERRSNEFLPLPMFPEMTPEQIDCVEQAAK